jgi:hypothetical protein
MPRGFSWVWLAIVAIAWAPSTIQAQATTGAPAGEKPKVDDQKPAGKDDPADDLPTAEVFTDPNAKTTLSIFSPINYSGPPISVKLNGQSDDRNKVQNMASKIENTNPDFLKNYVNFFTAELTRRDYLNALLHPPANAKVTDPATRGLERAVAALTMPLIVARAKENMNQEFVNTYTKILFESTLPKVLENNYLTRIDAMIVLGMAGSPTNPALNTYINEIKKDDQVVWVKLWAARGLSKAAQNGKVDLDASKSIQAAEALVGFLDGNPKPPWPAQVRALEALGSLRVGFANLPRGKIDAASTVMKILADPEAKLEARAWAAWSLGMMKIPPSIAQYNFSLIGYELGQVAVDLGQQIVQEVDNNPAAFDQNREQAEHLTGILLFQIYPALVGEEGVRESGLLHSPHPGFGTSKVFLTKLEELVKAVTRDSFELLKAGGGVVKDRRNDLDAKVADLKRFLEQSSPKDRHLVPGGPEFSQVAGAP